MFPAALAIISLPMSSMSVEIMDYPISDFVFSFGITSSLHGFENSKGFGLTAFSWGILDKRDPSNESELSSIAMNGTIIHKFRKLRTGDVLSMVADLDDCTAMLRINDNELEHKFIIPWARPQDYFFGVTLSHNSRVKIVNKSFVFLDKDRMHKPHSRKVAKLAAALHMNRMLTERRNEIGLGSQLDFPSVTDDMSTPSPRKKGDKSSVRSPKSRPRAQHNLNVPKVRASVSVHSRHGSMFTVFPDYLPRAVSSAIAVTAAAAALDFNLSQQNNSNSEYSLPSPNASITRGALVGSPHSTFSAEEDEANGEADVEENRGSGDITHHSHSSYLPPPRSVLYITDGCNAPCFYWMKGVPGIIPPEAFRIGSRLSTDGIRFESFYCVRTHANTSSRRTSTSSHNTNEIAPVEKDESTTWHYGTCVAGLGTNARIVVDGLLSSESSFCQYLVSSSSYAYTWIDGNRNRYISECVLQAPVDDEMKVAIARVLHEEELCLGLYYMRDKNDMAENSYNGLLIYGSKLISFDIVSDSPIEFLS